MQRRTFLGAVAAASGRALGSEGRVRAGIIGSGGRGRLLTGEFIAAGAEMAAVSDVYEPHLHAGLAAASPGAKSCPDYRRILDDRSIDAVVIATPDHWHGRMALDAVEAGKDVYLEKPMTHTAAEGFRLIEAVRRTKRVVQIGSQRRSSELFIEAKKVVDSGALGTVRLVNSWWIDVSPGALSAREPKGKLDWEAWLGPAPRRAFDPVRFSGWSWFFDYGGGYLAGQLVHIADAIHWMMNSTYPVAATSAGRFDLRGAEYPDTGSITLEYPGYTAVFTLSYKGMRYRTFADQMKQFHGSKARFDLGRESFALYPEDAAALDLKPSVEKRMPNSFQHATRAHVLNFLDCVRTRRDPNATVEHGQAAGVARIMAIEALRAGRRVRFDADARTIA